MDSQTVDETVPKIVRLEVDRCIFLKKKTAQCEALNQLRQKINVGTFTFEGVGADIRHMCETGCCDGDSEAMNMTTN